MDAVLTILLLFSLLLQGPASMPLMGIGGKAPGGSTIARVQGVTCNAAGSGSTSFSCILASTGAGHLLAIYFNQANPETLTLTFTGASPTYTCPASTNTNPAGSSERICYVYNTPSGITGVTFNYTAADMNGGAVEEYSGVQTSSDPFACGNYHSQSGTAYTSNSCSPAGSNNLLIGSLHNNAGSSVTPTPDSPWSQTMTRSWNGGSADIWVFDALNKSAGSYANTGTWPSSVGGFAVMAAFAGQ